ncbi:MAG TPA: hypothetical protein VIT45_01980 [Allosphingosinicella sp.]
MKYTQFKLAIAMAASIPAIASAQDLGPAHQSTMPPAITVPIQADRSADVPASRSADRVTYTATLAQRGITVPIAMADIVRLCADRDGCNMRLAMFNWDGTGRAASREFLFFYNPSTRGWRASLGDPQGFDVNTAVEHVQNAWACYVTDGEYTAAGATDVQQGFGLLSWFEYNADCWLTIIE